MVRVRQKQAADAPPSLRFSGFGPDIHARLGESGGPPGSVRTMKLDFAVPHRTCCGMRRKLLYALTVLVLAGAAFFWFTRPLPILTVTTWPGAYGRAQAAALMHPYAAAKRIDVRLANWDGDLEEVRKAVATPHLQGRCDRFRIAKGCRSLPQRLLERLDPGTLPAGQDGSPAARDFVPVALGPCWVGSVVYSQAIIFRKGEGSRPATLSDFFDKTKFPGIRALNRAPKFNLEMALLADGVAPKDVYALLGDRSGTEPRFQEAGKPCAHPLVERARRTHCHDPGWPRRDGDGAERQYLFGPPHRCDLGSPAL